MKSPIHVVSPPPKPVMVWDGDCNFCAYWIGRWKKATADKIEYLPFQDPSVASTFPEIPLDDCRTAVQLIETDGTVFSGAEAALRALSYHPRKKWMLALYQRFGLVAAICQGFYRFVARNRGFFSALTRLVWGTRFEPSSYVNIRWCFLRSLAVIYFIAFTSLWVQIEGLVGANGILPANLTIGFLRQQAQVQGIGLLRYQNFPTLCWFNTSDTFLKIQCAAGVVLAGLLFVGIAPAPCLFLMWLIYLSLTTICREFLSFQWDNLLLETGFLAIFFAPIYLFRRKLPRTEPPAIVLWLLRWLLFRLMLESGLVKLLSGDQAWRDLIALQVHYETQPLPTWIGWYAHQLPAGFHKASTIAMFTIELGAPLLIFAPRRLRHAGCVALVLLQLAIFLTGNYCFFNLLTLALCLLLLDDYALQSLIPRRWRKTKEPSVQTGSGGGVEWKRYVTVPLACIIIAISLIHFAAMFKINLSGAKPIVAMYQWLSPFRSINQYGLFAVMTTSRPEIIVEGSNDQQTWLAYEFKYKPGVETGRPRFVAPHQPRLDWQMWFAALGNYERNPWFVNFSVRLLQGSPEVLALLKTNPFPDAPPRYVRALVYDYRFTSFAVRRKTGAWWHRQLRGLYMPTVAPRQPEQAREPKPAPPAQDKTRQDKKPATKRQR